MTINELHYTNRVVHTLDTYITVEKNYSKRFLFFNLPNVFLYC